MPKPANWTPDATRRFWDRYSSDPANDDIYFAKQLGEGIAAILARELPSGKVLDLGCGPGYLVQHLIGCGYAVTGVDSSEVSVRLANERNRGRVGWRGASTDSSMIEAGSFDGVTCIETIEHLTDPDLEAVLAEIGRLLRPGGVGLITTPDKEILEESMMYCPFCDTEFHRVQHVRSWSAAELERVLVEAGFRVRFCAPTDLEAFISLRRLPWLGVRRQWARLADRRRRREEPFGSGPHLVAAFSPPG